MVECRRRHGIDREESDLKRLVTGDRIAIIDRSRKRKKDDTALRLLIHAEEMLDSNSQSRLLPRLAHGGGVNILIGIDESGWKGPGAHLRFVIASREQDTTVPFGDDTHGNLRIFEVYMATGRADGPLASKRGPSLQPSATVKAVGGRHDSETCGWSPHVYGRGFTGVCVCRNRST